MTKNAWILVNRYCLTFNNPLAELNQRIFDSSNGLVVNKVNIL